MTFTRIINLALKLNKISSYILNIIFNLIFFVFNKIKQI